jgi:predicted acyl esterase
VLTSSPEESLDHARKSATNPPSGRSIFSAVSGRNTAGRSRSAVTDFEFSSDALWSDRGLIDRAESTFQDKVDWRESTWPHSPNQTPPTFLLQLATLLKQRARRAAGRYVYSEQEYLLTLEAAQTSKGKEGLLQVQGKIRNLRTGRETPFRVWLEGGSDSIVPVRIEFQPRSFLRLTFEAVPA